MLAYTSRTVYTPKVIWSEKSAYLRELVTDITGNSYQYDIF